MQVDCVRNMPRMMPVCLLSQERRTCHTTVRSQSQYCRFWTRRDLECQDGSSDGKSRQYTGYSLRTTRK
jgi:hypothetical protein